MPRMILPLLLLAQAGVSDPTAIEPEHLGNPSYRAALETGLTVVGTSVTLPAPLLRDGDGSEAEAEALRSIAGSARGVPDLLRDSVTAPYVLRSRDIDVDGATIRRADLWFVVRADLAMIDPAEAAREADGQAVEAGNMRFGTDLIDADEAGLERPVGDEGDAWIVRSRGVLLDRIGVESLGRVTVSRSADSVVVASATADGDRLGNRWAPVSGTVDGFPPLPPDVAEPYAGGISYAKISRLRSQPGALLVEAHFAFEEPDGWFRGAPILRSKFSVIAQDQIRSLRRELARQRDGR